MSAREAAAAEAAATDAAVAAAAAVEAAAPSKAADTAAAHEAAAKAAAATNERRALDARTPSEKPDLPREPGGDAGLVGDEDFSGGPVFGVGGPGPHPRGDGAGVVTAPRHGLRRGHRDDLRPSHARVHGQSLGLVFAAADQDPRGRRGGPVPRRQGGDVQSRRGAQQRGRMAAVEAERRMAELEKQAEQLRVWTERAERKAKMAKIKVGASEANAADDDDSSALFSGNWRDPWVTFRGRVLARSLNERARKEVLLETRRAEVAERKCRWPARWPPFEAASVDAAVAAAAAAEVAAASKAAAVVHKAAAKAAAAANERRALDVRTLSEKPDLPNESGGGVGLMDGEDFSGRPVFGVGARVRVLAATAPWVLPRLATDFGEAIVTAFDPRTLEYTVKALALNSRLQTKIPEVAVVGFSRLRWVGGLVLMGELVSICGLVLVGGLVWMRGLVLAGGIMWLAGSCGFVGSLG